jgi:hypothetical protein
MKVKKIIAWMRRLQVRHGKMGLQGCADAAALLGLHLQRSFNHDGLLLGPQHAFSQSSNHPHQSDQKLHLDFEHYDMPH